MKHLNMLVSESIDNTISHDHLIATSKKTSSKILSKLTNIQPTTLPTATVYGMTIKTDKDVFIDHSVAVVETALGYEETLYKVTDRFSVDSKVYEVITDFTDTIPLDSLNLNIMVLAGDIRLVTDAPIVAVVQDSKFEIIRWKSPVTARLIKLDASTELLEDLGRSGMDSIDLVDDVIATTVSESINSDIIVKLITIAKKDKPTDLTNHETSYYKGRELICVLGRMAAGIKQGTTAIPTFVLCTPQVEAILKASGQTSDNVINGYDLEIICDTKSALDYVLVGCAGRNQVEQSSLYYSPLIIPDPLGNDQDAGIEMLFNRESTSMHPSYGSMVRYALTVAEPYSKDKVTEMDWGKYANNSKLTYLSQIIL
ncbi:hypothetical protein KO533_11725 [Shewanella sp. NKUCC05_KAH]|uniref:hypothetical protein n=1 Tax=Shewanella TaxID=22 RepID=UPI001C5AFF26|nr:hypothetical protein [Shewanella sp. NKUCC05_KAH]MBW3527229.1 hypothetical protein [Shewanella sp. NKUCC05_KAH]